MSTLPKCGNLAFVVMLNFYRTTGRSWEIVKTQNELPSVSLTSEFTFTMSTDP